MADKSLLQRCREAAAGHEAAHGADSRCLYHDLADELERLLAIETDVRRLLAYSAVTQTDAWSDQYLDPIGGGYASMGTIAKRRMEVGQRLLAAVQGA